MEEQIKCPKCEAMNSANSLVCEHCGTLLKEAPVPPTEASQTEQNIEVLKLNENEPSTEVPPTEPQTTPVSTTSIPTETVTTPVVPITPTLTQEGVVNNPEPQPMPNNLMNYTQASQPVTQVNRAIRTTSGKPFKIIFSIIVLLGIGGGIYFMMQNSKGKGGGSTTSIFSSNNTIKDENGEEHKIGEKSKHYGDRLEDKVKYLINSKPLDNNYNYIYLNDAEIKEKKLYYGNGKEIPLTDKDSVRIYDNFVAVQSFTNAKIYDRYGELVSEGEFISFDEYNNIFRTATDSYYNVNGEIAKDRAVVAINQSNFSILEETTPDKVTIINSSNKVLYEIDREKNDDYDIEFSVGSSERYKYLAITEKENGVRKSKIMNKETGAVIYQSEYAIEALGGNLFGEYEVSNILNYIFVQKDTIIFSTKEEPIALGDFIKNNDTIYDESTGDIVSNDINYKMSYANYMAYKEDGYEVFMCNPNQGNFDYGLRKGNNKILNCEYSAIEFFEPNIYKELKEQNKLYVVLTDKNKKRSIYNIKADKIVFENIKYYPQNRNIFIGSAGYASDSNEKKRIINLVSDKSINTNGGIYLDGFVTSVFDGEGTAYYSNDLKTIHYEKDDTEY